MEKSLIVSTILLAFFFQICAPAFPSETAPDVIEILSDSGFESMSLTLELVAQSLPSKSSSITVFAPSDEAFRESGQPSLNILQYHIVPVKFSLDSLKSLPYGTKIETLLDNQYLIVTSQPSDQHFSLNDVKINDSVIYDVGSVVVYGIGTFFDPEFQILAKPVNIRETPVQKPKTRSASNNLGCSSPFVDYHGISQELLIQHYSVIGQFLDMQLLGTGDKLTIFAPEDEELLDHLKNLSDFASIFRRHVVPCMLSSTDLASLEDGTTLPTFLKDFSVKISRSGDDVITVNGVPVVFPGLYSSDTVVVHGIQRMLPLQAEGTNDRFSEFRSTNVDSVMDYSGGEF